MAYVKKRSKSKYLLNFQKNKEEIPPIVEDIISYLENSSKIYVNNKLTKIDAIQEEGLFRINGDLKSIFEIRKKYQNKNSIYIFIIIK